MEATIAMIEFDLSDYRPNNTTSFIGRVQGQQVRKDLDLDNLDNSEDNIKIIIPKNTTSFNPSFFLGLLYDSIKHLGGIDKFKEKFEIVIEAENHNLKKVIEKNIADGFRNAYNSINNRSGFNFF